MGLSARITGGGVKTVIVTGDTDFVPHAATARVGQPTQPATAQGSAYAARVVHVAGWLVAVAGGKGAAAATVISTPVAPPFLGQVHGLLRTLQGRACGLAARAHGDADTHRERNAALLGHHRVGLHHGAQPLGHRSGATCACVG